MTKTISITLSIVFMMISLLGNASSEELGEEGNSFLDKEMSRSPNSLEISLKELPLEDQIQIERNSSLLNDIPNFINNDSKLSSNKKDNNKKEKKFRDMHMCDKVKINNNIGCLNSISDIVREVQREKRELKELRKEAEKEELKLNEQKREMYWYMYSNESSEEPYLISFDEDDNQNKTN